MSQPRAPMTPSDTGAPPGGTRSAPRRPRIAVMGEFSAGKSTLVNLLLGTAALPTRVTATQLPPVWIGRGTGAPTATDLEGRVAPVDLSRTESLDLATTRYLRIEAMAPILDTCDLIDFPGISDPNMPPDTWDRVMPLVDGVIWCTHATHAWRQSEAAFWDTLPEAARAHAVLLLTRIDRIAAPRDRRRICARVAAETEGAFAAIHPVSLTQATDPAARADSGIEAARAAIARLVALRARALAGGAGGAGEAGGAATADPAMPDGVAARAGDHVVPRRVRRAGGAATPRLSAEAAAQVVTHLGRP